MSAENPHVTQRLLMFEVYESGSDFPLLVTSDAVHARYVEAEGSGTDRIVKRWWVAEGRPET